MNKNTNKKRETHNNRVLILLILIPAVLAMLAIITILLIQYLKVLMFNLTL